MLASWLPLASGAVRLMVRLRRGLCEGRGKQTRGTPHARGGTPHEGHAAHPTPAFTPGGTEGRRQLLHSALGSLGFEESDMHALLETEEFRGSSALRSYTSYATLKPSRAAQIAHTIAQQVREVRASKQTWLRNHDRALSEGEASLSHIEPLHLVLDNLRSAENVGTIFRCAEAARCAHVHLCGFSPCPPHAGVLKTALGAAEYVRHSHSPSTLHAVRKLQSQGVAVWACETTDQAQQHWECSFPKPLALVLGNESTGVDVAVLEACDAVVQIPLFGFKNSLNVACASSVMMWEVLRQWKVHTTVSDCESLA
ncbi:MAG: hypothetical protein SGPRY_007656 [Prymnesium sp.]